MSNPRYYLVIMVFYLALAIVIFLNFRRGVAVLRMIRRYTIIRCQMSVSFSGC